MRYSLWSLAFAALIVPGAAPAAEQSAIEGAVRRGVQALRARQKADGSWEYNGITDITVGSTALSALTLLECGADKEDGQVAKAADYVRDHSTSLGQTYSLALGILLLDKLGDPDDEPLIQSFAARLARGQIPESGTWTYTCPVPNPAEEQWIKELVARRPGRGDTRAAPPGEGDPPRDEGDKKKSRRDGRKFQERLAGLSPGFRGGLGDNSNTQFAILGLWVARRHACPVDAVLRLTTLHFRSTQSPTDFGWPYQDLGKPGQSGTTPTMTCAGLLGLAIGFGVESEAETAAGRKARDFSNDAGLKHGLQLLAYSIDTPLELPAGTPIVPGGESIEPKVVEGRSYYFLWSLERLAVALNLETIGKKDWYRWGSNILVATQRKDGHWNGGNLAGCADTCFALLFLKRANLATDLSKLTGRMRDPGISVLRGGGVSGSALTGKAPAPNNSELKSGTNSRPPEKNPGASGTPAKPGEPRSLADDPGVKLAELLKGMTADEQAEEIRRVRDQKGLENTVALATAIPYLRQDTRSVARDALAVRLARMTPQTLAQYLTDEEPEIRAAAALACAKKPARQLIPDLIGRLDDRVPHVARAAYEALKLLTKKDFGPEAGANAAARKDAVAKWREWWQAESSN